MFKRTFFVIALLATLACGWGTAESDGNAAPVIAPSVDIGYSLGTLSIRGAAGSAFHATAGDGGLVAFGTASGDDVAIGVATASPTLQVVVDGEDFQVTDPDWNWD